MQAVGQSAHQQSGDHAEHRRRDRGGQFGEPGLQVRQALLDAVDGIRFARQIEQRAGIAAREARRDVALNAAGILHARKSFSTIPWGIWSRGFRGNSTNHPRAKSRRA